MTEKEAERLKKAEGVAAIAVYVAAGLADPKALGPAVQAWIDVLPDAPYPEFLPEERTH